MQIRPLSFSDRQLFIQSLAQSRNLAVACRSGERENSELGKKCEELTLAIDQVVGELVGDEAYLRDHSKRWG